MSKSKYPKEWEKYIKLNQRFDEHLQKGSSGIIAHGKYVELELEMLLGRLK